MRKVYQHEKSFAAVALAIFFSVVLTAVLFAALPFAHRIARPERGLELVKTSTVELPPVAEEEPPPQLPEPEPPPDAPPPPDIAEAQQQLPVSADLEIVTGAGGGVLGIGDIATLTTPQPIQEEVFDASELEKQPEPVSQVAPTYPSELRKAKIEGMARLLFVIGEDGRVEDARVESSTRPEFEKNALEAIRKWRFRPGQKDGKPVRTFHKIPFKFTVPAG